MKQFLRVALIVAVASSSLLSVKGCIFSPKKEDPVDITEIVPQTSPENVVKNLQAAYRLRRIEEYAKLLASDFEFWFQPEDGNNIGTDFWTRDLDSLGTLALFTTERVSNITIELIHGPAEPTNELNMPPGTMHIRIDQTQLEVDETEGTTWLATDLQDMFFRRGLVDAGEDTTHWFLLEWRDIPISLAPRMGSDPLSKEVIGPEVLPTTWGALRHEILQQEIKNQAQ
jgi:hypothetical protein